MPAFLLGNAGGPPQRVTGAPGEGTCANAGCHAGTGNPTAGGIEIDFGSPGNTTYTPGAKQTWTIRITGAQTAVYGFQASARLASDERNGQAGGFTPGAAGISVICADGREKTATVACRTEAPVEFIEHNEPKTTNSFTVEWTAPAAGAGNVRVFIAANAANGNRTNSGDRIFTANFTLTPGATTTRTPAIRSTQPIFQAFQGGERVSPGTWLELYGSNLGTVARTWDGAFTANGTRAPLALDGVSVKVGGKDAPIFFVNETQINFQVPDDVGVGNAVPVEVTTAGGRATTNVNVARVSPALLTTPTFTIGGRNYAAALFPDFRTFVLRENAISGVPSRPAKPGDTIIVFAVGCGPTTPASPAGVVVDSLRTVSSPVQVRFGQTVANAQAFMTPQAVGLCQFNITVPNVPAGDIALEATVDGVANGQNLFTTIGN